MIDVSWIASKFSPTCHTSASLKSHRPPCSLFILSLILKDCRHHEAHYLRSDNCGSSPPRVVTQVPHPSRPSRRRTDSHRARPEPMVPAPILTSCLLRRWNESYKGTNTHNPRPFRSDTNTTYVSQVKHDIKAQLTLSATGSHGGEGARTHVQVLANSIAATILSLAHAWALAKKKGNGDSSVQCFSSGRNAADLLVVGIVACALPLSITSATVC